MPHVPSLHTVYSSGQWSDLRRLLDAGAPIDALDETRRTVLHHAVYDQRLDIAHALLDRGARSDLPDMDASTALFDACSSDRPGMDRVVQRLLGSGAPVNVYRWEGWCRLMASTLHLPYRAPESWLHGFASQQEAHVVPSWVREDPYIAREVVKALDQGWLRRETPLSLAVIAGRQDLIDRLLDAGANPFLPIGLGASTNLLHLVARAPAGKHPERIPPLLNLGLSPSARNAGGQTPAEVAQACGHHDLAAPLLVAFEQQVLRQVVPTTMVAPPPAGRARL